MKKVHKKLIGVFGGTFDPIHNGHTLIIENFLKLIQLDELIVIPNGNPPHKAKGINLENKLLMTELALQHIELVHIDKREIIKESPSYGLSTFKELKKENPDDNLIWIMGSDSFSNIDTWYKYEEFLAEVNLIILMRPNCPIEVDSVAGKLLKERQVNSAGELEDQTCKILLLSIDPIMITSTEIRDMISTKKDVSQFLNHDVYNLIKEKNLYQ